MSQDTAAQNLFEQLFEDQKKALKDANKSLLAEDIKMTLTASVHNAKKGINRLQQSLNEHRADLQNIDFEAILDIKDELKDMEAQIESAKQEYKVFFGVTMP